MEKFQFCAWPVHTRLLFWFVDRNVHCEFTCSRVYLCKFVENVVGHIWDRMHKVCGRGVSFICLFLHKFHHHVSSKEANSSQSIVNCQVRVSPELQQVLPRQPILSNNPLFWQQTSAQLLSTYYSILEWARLLRIIVCWTNTQNTNTSSARDIFNRISLMQPPESIIAMNRF